MAQRIPALFRLVAGVLCLVQSTHAGNSHTLIQQGNAAYQSGNYEEALSAYDEASVDAPEAPEIYYNRGAVFYRQEDYDQAKQAFEKAALKSVEPILESRSLYNLGNCAFREAERQRDSDLQKAFESCEAAIKRYQDALRRNPELVNAAENIEIVRLYMKALLDEIEKQKQEQQQQQQQQEDLAQKLKQLIQRQATALEENRRLHARSGQPDASQQQEISLGMEDLTKEQRSIQTDSEAVSNQIQETLAQHAQAAQTPAQTATNQPAADPQQLAQMQEKLGKVRDHVDNAVGQQAEANRKLPLRQLAQAQPNQESSEAELKKALEALQDEDQQQQQQQGQNNEEGDKEEPEQQESSEDQLGQQQDGQQEEEQQEQEMQAAKAEDILNEEKDQREERRRKMPVRFRAVDKNW